MLPDWERSENSSRPKTGAEVVAAGLEQNWGCRDGSGCPLYLTIDDRLVLLVSSLSRVKGLDGIGSRQQTRPARGDAKVPEGDGAGSGGRPRSSSPLGSRATPSVPRRRATAAEHRLGCIEQAAAHKHPPEPGEHGAGRRGLRCKSQQGRCWRWRESGRVPPSIRSPRVRRTREQTPVSPPTARDRRGARPGSFRACQRAATRHYGWRTSGRARGGDRGRRRGSGRRRGGAAPPPPGPGSWHRAGGPPGRLRAG